MQGRKIAEHVMGLHTRAHRHLDYDKAASAIFTEPEIADVGLAEADAFAEGRKIRVTKVPFSASAKALINDDPRGFVKILSDPATGVVLGGSIVGRHAAELISVIALAVTAGLRSPTSSRACSCTRRWPRRWPTPPSDGAPVGAAALLLPAAGAPSRCADPAPTAAALTARREARSPRRRPAGRWRTAWAAATLVVAGRARRR